MRSVPAVLACAALLLAIPAPGCGGGGAGGEGDVTILTGVRFWTGDPEHPYADALLVEEGKIRRLLSREEIPRALAHGGKVIDLPGKLAVPGLVDAHGHLLGYGLARRRADLGGTRSPDEALERVRAFAAAHPADPWVLGRGWDQEDWPGHAWPTADRLEKAVPGRPCALWRVDGHALWVNRTALREAGIGPATPDPPGGRILRRPDGTPTGILLDAAEELVTGRIPPPSPAVAEEVLADVARDLLRKGLAGFHAMSVSRVEWDALVRLARTGRFPLRVWAYAEWGDPLAEEILAAGPRHEGRLHLVGVKLFADGALGSRGARLRAPYADDPGNRGLWVTPPDELARRIEAAMDRGLQPAVHAIGDAANHELLGIYRRLLEGHPGWAALRPRVEHAQVVSPADLPLFGRLPVVASMQPTHATSDMAWAEDRLGPDRLAGAYAWRSILAAGGHLAFGSDVPVEPCDPRLWLWAAVTRQDTTGNPPGGWRPDERLDLPAALAACSAGAAWAVGREGDLGRLAPGYLADLTVFDRDIVRQVEWGHPRALLEARVTATVIGGTPWFPRSTGRGGAR